MNNIGLRATSQPLEVEFSGGKAYIDLDNRRTNLITNLGLFQTIGKKACSLSLWFNLKNTSLSDFGYKIRLNYYSKISLVDNKVLVEKADGTIFEYIKDGNGYVNDELEDRVSIGSIIEFNDDKGNIRRYKSLNDCYPYEIESNGDTITIEATNNIISKITLANEDYIEFTNTNNLITNISYYRKLDSFLMLFKVSLSYNSNNELDQIALYKGTKEYSVLLFNYMDSSLKVLSSFDIIETTFQLSDNKVTQIIKTNVRTSKIILDYRFIYGSYTTIIKKDDKLLCTNYYNTDSDLVLTIDKYKSFTSYYNDSEYKVCLRTYNNQNINSLPLNLLGSNNIDSFTKGSNTNLSLINDTNVLGLMSTSVSRLNGEVSKTIAYNGSSDKSLCLLVFLKQLNTSSTSNIEIRLNLDGNIEDIDKLELKDYINEFRPIALGLTSKDSFTNIKVSINTNGLNADIAGIYLMEADYGTINIYNKNKLYKSKTISGTTSYIYDTSNRLSHVFRTNMTSIIRHYKKGNLITSEDLPNGVLKIYTYDNEENTNLIRTLITDPKNKLQMEETYTYDNYNNILRYRDTLGVGLSYSGYDNYQTPSTLTDILGVVDTYTRNNRDLIVKYEKKKDSSNAVMDYEYDKTLLTKVKLNSNTVLYTYDDYLRIKEVKIDNSLIYSYQYDNDNNLISFTNNVEFIKIIYDYSDDLLISKKYYDISKSTEKLINTYTYQYGNNYELKSILLNGRLDESFTYDSYGNLITESSTDTNISNHFENNKPVQLRRTVKSKSLTESYITNSDFKKDIISLLSVICTNDKYVTASFTNNFDAIGGGYTCESYQTQSALNDGVLNNDFGVPYAQYTNQNPRYFAHFCEENELTVGFWFKTEDIWNKKYLLSAGRQDTGNLEIYTYNEQVFFAVNKTSGFKALASAFIEN